MSKKVNIGDLYKQVKKDLEGYEMIVIIDEKKTGKAIHTNDKEYQGSREFYGKEANYRKKELRELTNKEIAEKMQDQYEFLTKPFKGNKNREVMDVLSFIAKDITFQGKYVNRIKNTFQAVIRNPILRGDYGSNSQKWQEIKGFNHPMIDTGSFFDSIKAEIIKKAS